MRSLAVASGIRHRAVVTFAAEGLGGQLRYDPMSMHPFMSYPEGDYVAHWLTLLGRLEHPPIFAHINWFQRDEEGGFIEPGYRENLRALLWLRDYHAGAVTGVDTPVGAVPAAEELTLTGLEIESQALESLLAFAQRRWRNAVQRRDTHLAQFALPETVTTVHQHIRHHIESIKENHEHTS